MTDYSFSLPQFEKCHSWLSRHQLRLHWRCYYFSPRVKQKFCCQGMSSMSVETKFWNSLMEGEEEEVIGGTKGCFSGLRYFTEWIHFSHWRSCLDAVPFLSQSAVGLSVTVWRLRDKLLERLWSKSIFFQCVLFLFFWNVLDKNFCLL